VAGGLGGDAIADAFVRALPMMARIWHTRTRPFLAAVTAQGKVTLIEGGRRIGGVKRD
jgi:hypothetical protein